MGITAAFGDSTFTDVAYYQVELTLSSAQEVVATGTTVQRQDNGAGADTWRIVAGPFVLCRGQRTLYLYQFSLHRHAPRGMKSRTQV